MKITSIKNHLEPYSLFKKRRTTINHAFASAIAPSMEYDQELMHEAMRVLGQNPEFELLCVYCGNTAETWDHVVGLVKNSTFSGFGHVVGNLVPCCKSCNQKKGNKSYEDYFAIPEINLLPGATLRQAALKNYIEKYSEYFEKNSVPAHPDKIKRLELVKEKILLLLKEGDKITEEIRKG